jgi:two-component SAPR family response regulator
MISVSLDIDEFESLCQQAAENSSDDEKASVLQKAIDLYGDGFAAGWYDDWVDDLRHYYGSRYEECLAELARIHSRKENFSEALVFVEKLIALNFLDEIYHRQYMELLGRLGRYQDIKSDFEKFSKRLKREMKVEPEKQTVDLYRSLIASDKGS